MATPTTPTSSTPSASERRLRKELAELNVAPPVLSAGLVDSNNLTEWVAVIEGPLETPYADGQFKVSLLFTELYPLKPPQCQMITKVYHPNISENLGEISLDVLNTLWKPRTTVNEILQGIHDLLKQPHAEKCLEPAIGEQYLNNQPEFVRLAKEYTEKYAKRPE
ncbi:unnamed protein product [Didymodactylos carnosus]|uniref:UBC core domain-containing protein n=1 Tax=Didymodactylos carnosus TaxID=1234261 RepID=A0A8S2D4Q1_9BILA|nr:unnamed protein product [Didymodactylos carnosus]CAF3660965.1 unnamed protein product [Didymodactylos carnosus]